MPSSLRLPDHRKPVYFGLGSQSNHLGKWVHNCHAMKMNRQERELARLRALEQIASRIELKRKFRDWDKYVKCKNLLKYHELLRGFRAWRQVFMMKRYRVLESLLNNGKILLRKRFQVWHDNTLLLRAVWHCNNRLKKKYFALWTALWEKGKNRLLENYFKLWKKWLALLKTLKKLVCSYIIIGT